MWSVEHQAATLARAVDTAAIYKVSPVPTTMFTSKQSAIYLQSTIKQSIQLEAVCGGWRLAELGARGIITGIFISFHLDIL